MEAKALSNDDLANGLELEAELAAIRQRLDIIANAYDVYVAILRKRYDAPEGEYELHDWAIGFELIPRGDGA